MATRRNFIGFIFLGVLLLLFSTWYVNTYSKDIIAGTKSTPYLTALFTVNLVYFFKRRKLTSFYKEFDERERVFMIKTIAVTTLLFLTMLVLSTDIRNAAVFGVPIKELYGYYVVPVFLLLWGVVGLIYTYRYDY